jgi:hypothetical protein
LFYNTLVFNRVTPAVTQVGSYSISLVNGQVQVNQASPTNTLVSVPPWHARVLPYTVKSCGIRVFR